MRRVFIGIAICQAIGMGFVFQCAGYCLDRTLAESRGLQKRE